MKDDGSKMIKWEQDSTKDQERKYMLGYFKDTYKRSCCEAGFPPVDSHHVNSKYANLEQPKEVMKNDGLDIFLICEQNDQNEENKKCGKKFF